MLLLRGEFGAVRAALDASTEDRSSDPHLGLIAALTHVDERALPAAAAALRQVRSVWPRTPGQNCAPSGPVWSCSGGASGW